MRAAAADVGPLCWLLRSPRSHASRSPQPEYEHHQHQSLRLKYRDKSISSARSCNVPCPASSPPDLRAAIDELGTFYPIFRSSWQDLLFSCLKKRRNTSSQIFCARSRLQLMRRWVSPLRKWTWALMVAAGANEVTEG